MIKRICLALSLLLLAALACGTGSSSVPPPAAHSIFDSSKTAYGFFPSPPEVSTDSVLKLYKDIPQHGDFVLIQQNTAWEDFAEGGTDGQSQTRTDLINQVKLARQNNLETVFVIDALNGLNRRDFAGLPAGWEASFGNIDVRTAYKNYALWVLRTFQPRYLGLASEINTYMDAHPEDTQNFISLYHELYALIKAEAPATQVFVTFQWDELNNMFPPQGGNRQSMQPNWGQVQAFEPDLDLWAISTYPYFVFPSGADIPAAYYSPLLTQTDKPLAIAESGFSSRPVGFAQGSPEDQVTYLIAIHNQLGPRLAFWVNTLLNDLNIQSYAAQMKKEGRNPQDAQSLDAFAYIGLRNSDGSPKPALATWDEMRKP